jgi:hypothetical protein
MDVAEYERLKKKADKLKAEAERAAGALEQTTARLKDEFGCDSLEAAEKLLKKKELEKAIAEEKYEDELEKFKSKWGEKLEVV